MPALFNCLAPAKLNLCLHVVGRRADGYHLLETVFQLIDWCDELDFVRREDGRVLRTNDHASITENDDLCLRAARLLQKKTGCSFGVEITLRKHIPMGGGLGGGSSDAATTLAALNQLWELGLNRETLMRWSIELGADVPFFLFGQNAFAQGIGEQLTPFFLPKRFFLIIHPNIHVLTPAIFQHQDLTRDTPTLKMRASCEGTYFDAACFDPLQNGHNDLEKVTRSLHPEVDQAVLFLKTFDHLARMTGSGASVFATFNELEQANKALKTVPIQWLAKQVAALSHHPCPQVSMLSDACC
jgi:4-diphosphocytidyl-2-C-methyl-D-erythritol kinase